MTTTERQQSITSILEQTAKAMFPVEREASIDVRTKNADGDTALHIAALGGDEGAVAQLLMAGAFVDEPGAGGRSALYYAALKGHTDIAAQLVAAGADPDMVMDLGMSPRTVATQHKDQRLIQLFGA